MRDRLVSFLKGCASIARVLCRSRSNARRQFLDTALLKRVPSEAGFTLLEVIVSLGILGTFVAISSTALVQHIRENFKNHKRYEGIQAAQTVLDKVRFEDISSLTGSRTESVTIGGRTYAVEVLYCQLSQYCISAEIRHITVRVTYRSDKIYETDTVYTKLS